MTIIHPEYQSPALRRGARRHCRFKILNSARTERSYLPVPPWIMTRGVCALICPCDTWKREERLPPLAGEIALEVAGEGIGGFIAACPLLLQRLHHNPVQLAPQKLWQSRGIALALGGDFGGGGGTTQAVLCSIYVSLVTCRRRSEVSVHR